LEDRHLAAPQVTDYPRLIGWSSLDLAHHRSLTSFVAIAGTVCRFQNRRAAVGTRVLRRAPRLTHATETTTPPDPSRGDRSKDQDAFRRVAIDQSYLALRAPLASMVRKRRATRTPFSPRSRRHVRQHMCGELLGQRHAADLPCGLPDVVARDALDRLLPSHFFVPVPAHRGFSLRRALARQHSRGTACFHDSAIRFGRVHRLAFWLISFHRGGVFFPPRCRAYLPLTPLSPLPRTDACVDPESRQDRLQDP